MVSMRILGAFTFLFLVVASCEGVPSQQQQILPLIKLVGSREPASGIQVLAVFHFFEYQVCSFIHYWILQLVVGKVTKHPENPLFVQDKPWEP